MTATRSVAMLDILGFREMVTSRPLLGVAQMMNALISSAEPQTAKFVRRVRKNRINQQDLTLGSLHFSDTILIWTPRWSREDMILNFHMFGHLCKTVANLIALALMNDLPLRGGITTGECYIDIKKGIVLGPAIVDAYLLEQAQDWIGAAIRMRHLDQAKAEELYEWASVVDYPVPTKQRSALQLGQALDWTAPARLPLAVVQKIWKLDVGTAIEQALHKGEVAATKDEERRKWLNAKEFLAVQRAQHPIKFRHIRGQSDYNNWF